MLFLTASEMMAMLNEFGSQKKERKKKERNWVNHGQLHLFGPIYYR